MAIHPTAIVDKSAEVDPTAEIGAYAIVEPHTRVAADTVIYPHAYVATGARIARGCRIHPFAVVGHLPQDVKFAGGLSYAEIGDGTIVREHASVHRGSAAGSTTIVGQRCFIMTTAHIAHNCVVGDDVTMVNSSFLAGHAEVGNRAVLGGSAMVHQFARIGELVMVHGAALCKMDVPPFMMTGVTTVNGVNTIGLRRAGLTAEERDEIRACYRLLYRSAGGFRNGVERVAEFVRTEPGRRLVEFLRAPSKRGYLAPPRRRAERDAVADPEP